MVHRSVDSNGAVCGHDVLNLEVNFAFDTFSPEGNGLHVSESPHVGAEELVVGAGLESLTGLVIPVAGELVEWDLDGGKLGSGRLEGGLVAKSERFPVGVGDAEGDVVAVVLFGGLTGDGKGLAVSDIGEVSLEPLGLGGHCDEARSLQLGNINHVSGQNSETFFSDSEGSSVGLASHDGVVHVGPFLLWLSEVFKHNVGEGLHLLGDVLGTRVVNELFDGVLEITEPVKE